MEHLFSNLTAWGGATLHHFMTFLFNGTDGAYLAWVGILVVFLMLLPQLLMLWEVLAEFIEGDVLSLIAVVVMLVFFPLVIMIGVLFILILLINWVIGFTSTEPRRRY